LILRFQWHMLMMRVVADLYHHERNLYEAASYLYVQSPCYTQDISTGAHCLADECTCVDSNPPSIDIFVDKCYNRTVSHFYAPTNVVLSLSPSDTLFRTDSKRKSF